MLKFLKETVAILMATNAHTAVKYVSPKHCVRVTRKLYKGKPDKNSVDLIVTIGRPNFLERRFIRQCIKAGEPFPVRKVQIKFPAKKAQVTMADKKKYLFRKFKLTPQDEPLLRMLTEQQRYLVTTGHNTLWLATHMNCANGTVKSRKHRARARLAYLRGKYGVLGQTDNAGTTDADSGVDAPASVRNI